MSNNNTYIYIHTYIIMCIYIYICMYHRRLRSLCRILAVTLPRWSWSPSDYMKKTINT